MNSTTQQHVRKILLAWRRDEAAVLRRIDELATEGLRVVVIDDTGVITDARTNQVLLTGHETEAEADLIRGDEDWLDRDYIWETASPPVVEPTGGLPASLCNALEEWLAQEATPAEEVAEWIGWTPEQVEECRRA
ncbi:hypothetical protein [Nocardiopsis synnemataformans]|uniref:hypothetical protein n=1 Tax=Nocardiopsis synnemataformans TaxID=61305 RepID=UPI003EC1420C